MNVKIKTPSSWADDLFSSYKTLEERINDADQLFVSLYGEWGEQYGKLEQFVGRIQSRKFTSIDRKRKNFWIVGGIGSGKTFTAFVHILKKLHKKKNIIIVRWGFDLAGSTIEIKTKLFQWWLTDLTDAIKKHLSCDRDKAKSFSNELKKIGDSDSFSKPNLTILKDYFHNLINLSSKYGIDRMIIILDEYDLLETLDVQQADTVTNMLDLIKDIIDEIVPTHSLFIVHLCTVNILRKIRQARESLLDRAYYGPNPDDMNMVHQGIQVCFLDYPLSRNDIEQILRAWTGNQDYAPFPKSFVTAFMYLIEKKPRRLADFYSNFYSLIEENKKIDQCLLETFEPHLDKKNIKKIIDQIREIDESGKIDDELVIRFIHVFLFSDKDKISKKELLKKLDDIDSPLIQQLISYLEEDESGIRLISPPSEGNLEELTLNSEQLVSSRGEIDKPYEPKIENDLRSGSKEWRDWDASQRVERVLGYLSYAFSSLTIPGSTKSKEMGISDNRHPTTAEFSFNENIGVATFKRRYGNGLSSHFKVLIYIDLGSFSGLSNPSDRISLETYEIAYKKMRDNECVSCWLITRGTVGQKERILVNRWLTQQDIDYSFIERDARIRNLDVSINVPKLDFRGIKVNLKSELLGLLCFIGKSVEQGGKIGENASDLENENRSLIWKDLLEFAKDYNSLFKKIVEVILPYNLYEEVYLLSEKTEKDIFWMLTNVLNSNLNGQDIDYIRRELLELEKGVANIDKSKFESLFWAQLSKTNKSLSLWGLIEFEKARTGKIYIPDDSLFERYLSLLAGKGSTTKEMVKKLFQLDEDSDFSKADSIKISNFVKELLEYAANRGNLERYKDKRKIFWHQKELKAVLSLIEKMFEDLDVDIETLDNSGLSKRNDVFIDKEGNTFDLKWHFDDAEELNKMRAKFDKLNTQYKQMSKKDLPELEKKRIFQEALEIKKKVNEWLVFIDSYINILYSYILDAQTKLKEIINDEQWKREKKWLSELKNKIVEIKLKIINDSEIEKGEAKRWGYYHKKYFDLPELAWKASDDIDKNTSKIKELAIDSKIGNNHDELTGLVNHLKDIDSAFERVADVNKIRKDINDILLDRVSSLIEQAYNCLNELQEVASNVEVLEKEEARIKGALDRITKNPFPLDVFKEIDATSYIKHLNEICKSLYNSESLLIKQIKIIIKRNIDQGSLLLMKCKHQLSLGICKKRNIINELDELTKSKLDYKEEEIDIEKARKLKNDTDGWYNQVNNILSKLREDISKNLKGAEKKIWDILYESNKALPLELIIKETKLTKDSVDDGVKQLINKGLVKELTLYKEES